MGYYLLVFAAGFAGSFHCIGMCGGFACVLGANATCDRSAAVRHLLYNSGRLATYVFLGGIAGSLGAGLAAAQGPHAGHGMIAPTLDGALTLAQRSLSVLAGLLMLAIALQLLGRFNGRHVSSGGVGATRLAGVLGRLVRAPGAAAPLALGVANGFLPCPLVYAFVLQAMAASAPAAGMAIMLAFGLGTFPAMLLMGGVGRLLAPTWRSRGVRVAAVFILVLGAMTLARGLLPMTLFHAHPP